MTFSRTGRSNTTYAFQSYLARVREDECPAQEVPAQVLEAYSKKYPAGSFPNWIRLNSSTYSVFFLDRIWYKLAKFHIDYGWLETRVFSRSPEEKNRAYEAVSKLIGPDCQVESIEILRNSQGTVARDVIVRFGERLKRIQFDNYYTFISKNSLQYNDDALLEHLPEIGPVDH